MYLYRKHRRKNKRKKERLLSPLEKRNKKYGLKQNEYESFVLGQLVKSNSIIIS